MGEKQGNYVPVTVPATSEVVLSSPILTHQACSLVTSLP